MLLPLEKADTKTLRGEREIERKRDRYRDREMVKEIRRDNGSTSIQNSMMAALCFFLLRTQTLKPSEER